MNMQWYVFALVDTPPKGPLGRGLKGPVRARPMAGAFAIVERRADVPPVELGSLRAHQAVVARLATAAPAILPVRFGTLMEGDALEEALNERDEEIAEAFALVRHRAQFTWRRDQPSASRLPKTSKASGSPGGGAAYLQQAAKAANTPPPPAFTLLRDRLHAFVVRERFQPAANGMPDTLYQLIEKTAIDRYRAMADALTLTTPGVTVSGPWAPFAFAPELL
jgi:hypothetical protein